MGYSDWISMRQKDLYSQEVLFGIILVIIYKNMFVVSVDPLDLICM